MAIQHLTEEQISTWSRTQKDEWWFKNVEEVQKRWEQFKLGL